ncbi:esterase EstP [Pseudomonas sp. DC3000-4b1]|uniref:esterase EstP n=1 Tax=unclassified Pseudomonas TaxID=196821 RepID=UPI003CE76B62
MMKKTALATAVALGLALGVTPASANPSPYSTMIVFGDSLSDAGQFPDLAGPLGASTRFTNRTGPSYKDGSGEIYGAVSSTQLGTRLGVDALALGASTSAINQAVGLPDGNNWATGGYRTDQIYDSITGESRVEIGGRLLRSRPGYLANGNRADPNALYYLSGGGNDFIQGQVTSAATASAAAGRLASSVSALQQAGARYIMVWLLPDLGLTPYLYGTANQAGTSALSAVFNQTLVSQLAQIDAEIIPLNVPLLLSEVVAEPGRYGLATDQNLLGTCFSGNGCTENAAYGLNSGNADPSKLLFNDSVHPTSAGQKLIADYAYSLLSAPWELTLLPELAHGSLRSHQDSLRAQWNQPWQAVGQWQAMLDTGGQSLDMDGHRGGAKADGHGLNLMVGGSYRLDTAWRLGLAGGYYRQRVEAGAADSDYSLNSYLGTAFAQYRQGRVWADLAATAGKLDYDQLKRTFDLGLGERSEKGDSQGELWALSGRLGYNLMAPAGPWQVSPFISADYASVKVDGYSEKSAQATALNVDDQRQDSRRLGLGLHLSRQLTPATLVFGELAHERELNDDAQYLDLSLRSLPANGFKLQGYSPARNHDRASLGLRHQLSPGLALNAAYHWRGSGQSTQQGVNLALSLDF